MERNIDVSVIMINYNTFELTKNAIESILQNTREIEYEIVLIDNCSPDKSGEKLKEYFSDKIIFVQSGGNLGTSKAFNIGLKNAKGKYVLWLNTDVLLIDNFIKTLHDFMIKNPNCGICGGNVLNAERNPAHSYHEELVSLKTVKRENGILFKAFDKLFKKDFYDQYNYTNKPKEVGYVTGADMMIRREVIDKIGGFNEDIFMYGEEVDFTFRMIKNTDYKVYSVPDAKIVHLEGASFDKNEEFNEWRTKTILLGNSTYFKVCYGKESAIKYIKILIKSAKFKKFLCAITLNKTKKLFYTKFIECAITVQNQL